MRTVSMIAAAALAFAGVAQAATTLNIENRVLLIIDNKETHAQAAADIVGDIWQENPQMIAWARQQDLPKLAKAGVQWTVHEEKMDELSLKKLQENGAAPFEDGSIIDVNGLLHDFSEFKTMTDVAEAKRMEDPGQVYADDDWYLLYRPYADIIYKAKTYALSAPKDLNAEWHEAVSYSFEGRPIPAMEYGGKNNVGKESPKFFYYHANQHAREWIAGHGALYATREYLRLYGEGDAEIVSILDNVRMIYIPIVNPDGYKFSWFVDRFWRKNRRPFTNIPLTDITISTPGLRIVCPTGEIGTDLNRNWGYVWAEGGSSDDACSDVHHGPFAFSESEILGISDWLTDLKVNKNYDFLGGLDFHTYSGLLLRPWQYTFVPEVECPDNQAWLTRSFERAKQMILDNGGIDYKNQHGADLYIHSGGALDWFYGNLTDFRIAGTPEMRPSEDSLIALGLLSGFAPPPTDIIPGGMEAFMILKALLMDAAEFARGEVPRRITDDIYLQFYGDEGYYTDEYNAPLFCFEPKDPEPEEPVTEGETETAANGDLNTVNMNSDVGAESSAVRGASVTLASAAVAVAAIAAALL